MINLRIIMFAAWGLLLSNTLFAAFPGQNGKIVFERAGGGISIMNADGTGETILTTGDHHDPKWSADGTRILFVIGKAPYTMNADGSNISEVAGLA